MFLFAALTLTWVVLFSYLLFVNGRLTGLRRQLDALEQSQADDEPEKEDL